MNSSSGYTPAITGSLKIDLKLFPEELLKKIMEHPYQTPVLTVRLPRVVPHDGITIETSWNESAIEFDFAANDIEIAEAK